MNRSGDDEMSEQLNEASTDVGADAVGLNFYPKSPRFVTPTQAARLVRALPPFTAPVGVFVGMPLRQVTAVAFQLGFSEDSFTAALQDQALFEAVQTMRDQAVNVLEPAGASA